MKKYLIPALALGLVMTSCQSDEPFAPTEGGEKQVTFTLNVPGELGTRAGEAYNSGVGGASNVGATNINYTLVLDAKGDTRVFTDAKVSNDGRTATFTPTVVLGRDYTITAYASFDDNTSINAKAYIEAIEVSKNFNDETKDAYFYTTRHNFANGDLQPLTLTRPYAKLRLVATDYQAEGNGNTAIKSVKVKYKNNVFTTFNAVSGEFSGEKSYEYTLDETNNYSTSYYAPEVDENGDVIGQTIFADYIPVQLSGDHAVPFIVTVEYANGEKYTREFNQDIPVRRNALTTLKGNFFTAGAEIKVEVKDAFEGQIPGNDEEQLIIAAAMGGEVTLTDNVELDAPLNVQANMTLNLGGYTITTTLEEEGRHHYAILNNANLVIEGEGAINARGIKNFGEMTVNGNVTITNLDSNGGAAIWNEGKVTINNGTFISSENAGAGTYGAALNTRSGGEAVVNGGTFEAYSQLTYAIVNEGKTTINNATVKGKHGAVAGSSAATTTINGGSFELMENPGVSDHCTYYVSDIKGGSFTLGNNTDSGAKVFCESTIAAGYKVVEKSDKYYVVPEEAAVATNTSELKEALANSDVVAVAAGEYTTFPAADFKAGQTLVCAEGVVFKGTSGLNINGATVIGATFSNPSGNAVAGKINGTFKNCTFEGSNALRGCYAGETVVFENCEFSGSTYGVHFDGGDNKEITFEKCKLSGFNAFAAAVKMVTFENCTFVGNGKSGYNGANLWGSAKMIACEFKFDGTTANEWIDCIGTDKTYEFTNCTVNGVAYTPDNYQSIENIFSRNNAEVTINGEECQL